MYFNCNFVYSLEVIFLFFFIFVNFLYLVEFFLLILIYFYGLLLVNKRLDEWVIEECMDIVKFV